MDPLLRPATAEDAQALGVLMYIAAESGYTTSGYDLTIGGSRARQQQVLGHLAATHARSWFHYSHFRVAEDNGTVLAAVAGFDRSLTDPDIPDALREIGWTNVEIDLLNAKLEPISRCFPADKPGSWTIEHVATLPSFRRMGLVRQLLSQQMDRGREAGYALAQLDVFSTNRPATALYQSLGFRRDVEFGDETFQRMLQRDPMWRMKCSLV